MKIYTYWVNQTSTSMPAYIQLCMYSWELAIPGVQIEIINHENIGDYLPNGLLTSSFYDLSLAMQSDVVSVWVLMSRGGVFIDADTIMTGNPFEYAIFSEKKLTAFGCPERKSIHLAILCSPEPNNPLLVEWVRAIFTRLNAPLPNPLPWNYVGNSIINMLLNDQLFSDYFNIIDARVSGNILELASDKDEPYLRYLDFYFTAPTVELNDILKRVRFNLISLHNSWTPDSYRKASLETIIETKDTVFLSHLLLHLFNRSNLENK